MADPTTPLPSPGARIIGFPPRAPATKTVSGGLVKAILEKAQDTLGQALGKLFEQADDTLFDLAGPGHGHSNASFFDGFREMRRRRPSIERVFREQLAEEFAQWESSQAQPANVPSAPALGELSLVSDEQFEEDLAITAMVTHADGLVRQERPALERRLAVMRGATDKESVHNPLSPQSIGDAFRKAMAAAQDVDLPVRLVVYKLFDRMVMVRLPELYQQINRDLSAAGILPELQAAPARPAPQQLPSVIAEPEEVSLFGGLPAPDLGMDMGMAGLPAQGFTPSAVGSTETTAGPLGTGPGASAGPETGLVTGASAVAQPGQEGLATSQQVAGLLRTLVSRLSALPTGQGPGVPGHEPASGAAVALADLPARLALSPPGATAEQARLTSMLGRIPAPAYTSTDLLSAIARLRLAPAQEQTPGQIRATLAALLAAQGPGTSSMDPAARVQEASARISSDHEVAIEMISMLFEFIAEDHALSPELRATLGRLQLPYLRAAIHDPEWFAKEDHPARELLNQMAEAGKGCPEHDHSPLVELIEKTVDRIFEASDEDREVFAREKEHFSTQIDLIRQRSERSAERARQTLSARERREDARRQVAEKIVEMLAPAKRLPEPMREVLMRAWAHNMVMLALRFGVDSAEYGKSVQVVEYLAQLCGPAPLASTVRTQLENQREAILKTWREGLFYAGLHESDVRVLAIRLESLAADLLDPLAIAVEQRDNRKLLPPTPTPRADDPAQVIARIPHTSILDALDQPPVPELDPKAMEPLSSVAQPSATDTENADPAALVEPLEDASQDAVVGSSAQEAPGSAGPKLDNRFPGFEVPVLPPPTPMEIAKSLQKDQWIQLRTKTETRRLRLCWVSGLTGRLLFVNTYGQSGWDTTREEVANYIASGDLTLVENGEVVDRAMTTIREKLRQRLSGLLGPKDPNAAAT